MEVVTTFFALKLAEPEGIFFTRGNHESKNMNKIYGFEGEVIIFTVFCTSPPSVDTAGCYVLSVSTRILFFFTWGRGSVATRVRMRTAACTVSRERGFVQ